MFLVIIFLALAAYLFPEWSGAAILVASFAGVVAFRLILFFTARPKQAPKNNGQS